MDHLVFLQIVPVGGLKTNDVTDATPFSWAGGEMSLPLIPTKKQRLEYSYYKPSIEFLSLQTATVKEMDRNFQKLSQYAGEVDPSRKKKIMAIG
jgi:hypothetical protein